MFAHDIGVWFSRVCPHLTKSFAGSIYIYIYISWAFKCANIFAPSWFELKCAYYFSKTSKRQWNEHFVWTKNFFSTHGSHLAIFSPAIYLGWMPDQQVMSIRQLENQISRARVQNRNFMRLHNDTDYLRELCGWLRIPWFWLRKNNTLQRANMGKQTQISTNECKLNMCEFRSHLLLQKPDERVKCTRVVSWVQSRDINCTTTEAVVTILMKHDET